MVFQWFVTIFVIVSGLILFSAWGRAIGTKYWIRTAENERDWSIFRILVLIALLCEIVLLIIALLGLQHTFAWLAAIFLIYLSVLFYFSITLFQGFLVATELEGEDLNEEARNDLSFIEGLAVNMRDQGAATAEDLRRGAGEIAERIRGIQGRSPKSHPKRPRRKGGKH